MEKTSDASGLFEGQVHPCVRTNTRFEPGEYALFVFAFSVWPLERRARGTTL